MQKQPLILTLRLDDVSQAFFDEQRQLYFPPERNFLKAHLTLFHQLPDDEHTYQYFQDYLFVPFQLKISGLMNLGSGVAYRIESQDLMKLRQVFHQQFATHLIPQDQQGFRPHITIMNKSTPDDARSLLAKLSREFQPFTAQAVGLKLWRYLGGPWEPVETY